MLLKEGALVVKGDFITHNISFIYFSVIRLFSLAGFLVVVVKNLKSMVLLH